MSRCCRLFLVLGLSACASAVGQCAQPADASSAATDSLPPGAIARLSEARVKDGGKPSSLSFSPDSKTLVVGGFEGVLSFWDLGNLKRNAQWEGHVGPVNALAISPDSKTFASAGRDNEIRIWRMSNSMQTIGLPGDGLSFKNLRFSPDGARLVSDDTRNLVLWDLRAEKPIFHLAREGFGGAGGVFLENASIAFQCMWKIASPRR